MIPNPKFDNPSEITFEERDKLMHFNTKRWWHCYYDKNTDKLYNEYCRLVKENAYDYLLSIGCIDKDRNLIKYFED